MRPGEVINERFVLERVVGEGGMGTVWRAKDLQQNGAPVALKVLLGMADAERFAREARVLAELSHPSIVHYVADGATSSNERWLAMEWLEGEDLAARLSRGTLTVEETLQVGRVVAEALAYTHTRGVVHRDLKPSNLFLRNGELSRVTLVDFGLARGEQAQKQALTVTGTVFGTPAYMAPEQAQGSKDIDARADVFAFACVLYECLAGAPPFGGSHQLAVLVKILLEDAPSIREVRSDVPAAFEMLLLQMLAKTPEQRPANGTEVSARLRQLSREESSPRETTAILRSTREHRLVSVVFVSLAQAETAVEKTLDSNAAAQPMGVFSLAQNITTRFEGTLTALANGSLLVTFATGTRSGAATDVAARAARCALAMRAAFPGASLSVATGRGDPTARRIVGEAIDRGASLLSQNAPSAGSIRLDEATAGLLDVRFEVGGDTAGLVLLSEREAMDAARTLLGRATPCVGRERDLAALMGLYEEALAEEAPRVALLLADVGVGKSRLRYEFLRMLAQRDDAPQVWFGNGDPVGIGSTFALLAPALRREAGVSEGLPLALQQQKLRARIARHVPAVDVPRVTAFLGELIGVAYPEGESAGLRAARTDSLLMSDQLRRAWGDFLEAELRSGPVVLVLEDLHWSDPASVQFVDTALHRVRDRPWMVLALARPEVRERFPELWRSHGVVRSELQPLSRKASERLARVVLGGDAPKTQIERAVERADGNPLLLEELLRAEAEGQGANVPSSVLAIVQARIDALEPSVRGVLCAASVFGQVCWIGGIERVLGPDGTRSVRPALSTLATQELLSKAIRSRFAEEEEYTFCHALVRDAAYKALDEEARRSAHRSAGSWLEEEGNWDAAVVAQHFELGGELSRAVPWFQRAASVALEANDLSSALTWCERARACGATGVALGRVRRVEAEVYRWKGEVARAYDASSEAVQLLPHDDEWCIAAGIVARTSARLAKKEQLLAIAEEVRAVLREGAPSVAKVRAAASSVFHLLQSGETVLAIALLSALEETHEPASDDTTIHAWLEQLRAIRARFTGRLDDGLAHYRAAVRLLEGTGDQRNATMWRMNLADALKDLGVFAEAERGLREVLSSAKQLGLQAVVSVAKVNLGLVLAHTGAFSDAMQLEQEAFTEASAQGERFLVAASLLYLAKIQGLAGDVVASEKTARQGLALEFTGPTLRASLFAVLSNALRAQERGTEALAAAEAGIAILREGVAIEEGEALLRLVYAEALHAVERTNEAQQAISDAKQRIEKKAERIGDEAVRQAFLQGIPEHARTLTLASQWNDG